MGQQLIFCVETNKTNKSDEIYIKQTINKFFQLDQAHQKLSWVYMDGKGKYASNSVKKAIGDYIKKYKVTSDSNESVVIYCFDCDDFDIKKQDEDFLNTVQSYCDENDYRFVWFCKDIEQVFLGKSIEKNKKGKEAASFAAKGMIDQINLEQLKKSSFQNRCSNLGLMQLKRKGDSIGFTP